MSSSEIRAYAEAIFADLLADSVLSTTIEAHREIKRGQVVCATCGTRCRSHAPINPPSGSTSAAASREPSPAKTPVRAQGYSVGPERGTGGGTGIGSGSGRLDGAGNAFFECLVCGRSITSSRYAPHLASCLGFSGSTRRGASRMAAAKARMGANDRASPSPYLASENDSDADSTSGKRKKYNGMKRGASPTKMFKKKHAAHSGSAPPPSTGSKPLPPSRLGRPPINKAHSASPYPSDKGDKGDKADKGDKGDKADKADKADKGDKEKEKPSSFKKDRNQREGSAASTAYSRPRSATPVVGRKTLPGTSKTMPGGYGGYGNSYASAKTLPGQSGASKTLPGQSSAASKTLPGQSKTMPGGTPPVSGQVQENGDDSSEADDDY